MTSNIRQARARAVRRCDLVLIPSSGESTVSRLWFKRLTEEGLRRTRSRFLTPIGEWKEMVTNWCQRFESLLGSHFSFMAIQETEISNLWSTSWLSLSEATILKATANGTRFFTLESQVYRWPFFWQFSFLCPQLLIFPFFWFPSLVWFKGWFFFILFLFLISKPLNHTRRPKEWIKSWRPWAAGG